MNENIRVLGIDDEGPVSDIQTQNNVNVPRIDVDLSEEDFLQLQELAVSHFHNDEHGEQAYKTVRNHIEEILAYRANVIYLTNTLVVFIFCTVFIFAQL